jgi:formylglycine-generating enzyme required for sulfatase activity
MAGETNDEMAAEMLRKAARLWYRAALPRAAGVDLAKVQGRLDAQRKVKPKGGFAVALNGLGGLTQMTPAKPPKRNVAPTGGFATVAGKATIEYPVVPAAHYVHEIELTMAAPQGSLKWRYGGWTGTEVNLSWNEARFVCRLYRYSGGGLNWWGQKEYQTGERLRFTVYALAGKHRLFRDGAPALGADSVVQDLRFRIFSGDNTRAVIHRCEFRPMTELDSQLLRTPLPIFGVRSDVGGTALTLHERNLGLENEPSTKKRVPFFVESTGTAMQWIPEGKYLRIYGEGKPTTEIVIPNGFWIGRYEVTQEEWMTLAKDNPSRVTGSPYLPVDGVSYTDALQFCGTLNEREKKSRRLPSGYVYRLPTEAEWEYACRAGAPSDFSVEADDFWHRGNSGAQPHEVGRSKPNAFGLYDMHGNVSEWVLDAWQDWPNPPPGRLENPFGPPKSLEDFLSVRGGSWWQKSNACSSLSRAKRRSAGTAYRGFRIVLAPLYKPPRR